MKRQKKQHKDGLKKYWQGNVLLLKMENNHIEFQTREICTPRPPQEGVVNILLVCNNQLHFEIFKFHMP